MKKFIALYKAFSGGEWLPASLDAVSAVCDGAIVMFSERPWTLALGGENDCKEPLREFSTAHPQFPVSVIHGDWRDQGEQYRAGLQAIRSEVGGDSAVLVIDTDEIWDVDSLRQVRQAAERCSDPLAVVRAGIRTYIKSPLYRVWPKEAPHVVVGLASAQDRKVKGRFGGGELGALLADVQVHHFAYVRQSDEAIRRKFLNTCGQEHAPSDYSWFDRIWDKLPDGENLHMTVGFEHCWKRVKTIPVELLPPAALRLAWVREKIRITQEQWRLECRNTPPDKALIPVPTADDADIYREDFPIATNDYADLVKALKCTVLEALHLFLWAHGVPHGGRILEIGSGSGGSLACFALGSDPSVELVSIDPFEPYDELTHAGLARGVTEGDEAAFYRTAERFGYLTRIKQVKLRSHEAAAMIEDGSCDIVFDDGNHSYEVVKDELGLYRTKLKPGGLLCGHDYTTRFPGVIAAADEAPLDVVHVPCGTSLFRLEGA